jgi:cytochrome P450
MDVDPHPFLRKVMADGNPVWDEGMASWLVTDFDDCATVLKREDLFAAPFARLGFSEIWGPRGLFMLKGDPHRRLYGVVRRFFTASVVEGYRDRFVAPLIDERIRRILSVGRADLATEYADQIPIRIIAGILGLDWHDEQLARDCLRWTTALQAHTANYMLPGGRAEETREAAAEGVHRLDDVLRPIVERPRDLNDGSYISEIARVGPDIFHDWTTEDTLDQCRFLYVAGMHTTSALLCNGIHLLLTNPDALAAVREDPERTLPGFVEETLRLNPSLQLRVRIATEDLTLGGVKIRADEQVVPILAAANRCPTRYEHPDKIDLTRTNLGSHLSFNAGPRFCGGAPLARVEAIEGLRALIDHLPGLRLDPASPPPIYTGFVQRTSRPLNVLFDTAGAEL